MARSKQEVKLERFGVKGKIEWTYDESKEPLPEANSEAVLYIWDKGEFFIYGTYHNKQEAFDAFMSDLLTGKIDIWLQG